MPTTPCHSPWIRQPDHQGFSLVELLLALSLGIGLSGLMLQVLINESSLGLRVHRLLRERAVQRRTLALIRDDVQRSSDVSATPQNGPHACNLGERLPVLHLSTPAGAITYSVGRAPGPIWHGQVLMRCGPAFDLNGQPSAAGTAQNRVLLDGLAVAPEPWNGCAAWPRTAADTVQDLNRSSRKAFSACLNGNGPGAALGIRLVQEFKGAAGPSQRIHAEALIIPAV